MNRLVPAYLKYFNKRKQITTIITILFYTSYTYLIHVLKFNFKMYFPLLN